MPTEVIDRIEVLAIKDNDLVGIILDDSFSHHKNSDLDSYVYEADVTGTLYQDNNMQEIAEDNNRNKSIPDYNVPEEELDINVDHNSTIQYGLSVNDDDEVSANENDESGNVYSSNIELTNDVMSDEDEQNEYNIDDDMDERYGMRASNYNLRSRRERMYEHLFVIDSIPLNTPQMSMRQGIALFCEDEMGSTLSIQDKHKALGCFLLWMNL